MFKSPFSLRAGLAMHAAIGAALAMDAATGGGMPVVGPSLTRANNRFYRQRGHRGVGTKAYQRAALKKRNQRAAR